MNTTTVSQTISRNKINNGRIAKSILLQQQTQGMMFKLVCDYVQKEHAYKYIYIYLYIFEWKKVSDVFFEKKIHCQICPIDIRVF